MSCLASILHTDKKAWSIEEEDITSRRHIKRWIGRNLCKCTMNTLDRGFTTYLNDDSGDDDD